MPKKHKAKGNQQKHNKRKSFPKYYDSDDESPPRTGFSLRDEVSNTGKHHLSSGWSPSVQLRHQKISFVSAGTTDPMKESEFEKAADEVDESMRNFTMQPRVVDDYLEEELENSEGAMAQMKIDGSAEATLEVEEESVIKETHMGVEGPEPAVDLPVRSAEVEEPSTFMIDVAGDPSLKPTDSKPPARRPSLAQSSSGDEVILFHGRKKPLVRDDPIPKSSESKPPHSTQPVSQSQQKAQQKASADMVSNNQNGPAQETGLRNTAGDGAPPHALLEPPEFAFQSNTKRHAQGIRAVPGGDFARADEWDLGDDIGMSQSRKSKKARKKDNKRFKAIENDPEDDILQDYVDNMDEEERAQILGLAAGDEDEWLSTDDDDDKAATKSKLKSKGKQKANRANLEDTEISFVTSQASEDVDMDDFDSDDDDDDDEDDEDEDEDDDDDFDLDDSDGGGDDSELEEVLDILEREQWEDEADLRQRQQDAMTDEEIARILAKQDELGISGNELILFDDSGFGDLDSARAGLEAYTTPRSRPTRRSKRGGRKSDNFPDASLMADVLEQDPYGGFDIMDFDRPSLKKKPKGRKSMPDEFAGLSDEELIADLQSAWANDRSKKAAKKAEREEMRAMGLLGRGHKKGKVDMNARYNEGMDMVHLRLEVREFLETEGDDSKAFPPMDKTARKVLHHVAQRFNLKSSSRGAGKKRFTVFTKTQRTLEWDESLWGSFASGNDRAFLPNMRTSGKRGGQLKSKRAGGGGGGGSAAVTYRHGEVVGGMAPEIAENNFGRRLMEKMGWSKGMALGNQENVEGRLLEPVAARIKSGRGGLGEENAELDRQEENLELDFEPSVEAGTAVAVTSGDWDVPRPELGEPVVSSFWTWDGKKIRRETRSRIPSW
ncbi:hypothetical protein MBLNU457_g2730t1 [Dothideomycetes sp. NU457]